MPQPLKLPVSVEFAPVALLRRPQLAAHIGVVVGIWSQIEVNLGTLLAALIGAEAKTVLAIYLSLTSAPAQRAVIEAAANLRLNHEQRSRLSKLLILIGKRGKERNLLVHASWGISDAYPDALIWADPKDLLEKGLIEIEDYRIDERFDLARVGQKVLVVQRRYRSYTEEDFRRIEERLSAALSDLTEFSAIFIEHWLGFERRPLATLPLPAESPPLD
ncbi:MAG: hypothetical protein P4L90_21630 [Rhodopila sp.]|nr:hypothetical protein [Rhodopila sp.]